MIVEFSQRYVQPNGALFMPGERAFVPDDEGRTLVDCQAAKEIPPSIVPVETPPMDKMIKHPVIKGKR